MTPRERTITLIATVADRHGVTVSDIFGKTRKRHIVNARHEAMRLCAARPLSSKQIGQLFRCDHTTVLHAIRKGGGAGRL